MVLRVVLFTCAYQFVTCKTKESISYVEWISSFVAGLCKLFLPQHFDNMCSMQSVVTLGHQCPTLESGYSSI